ncbi:pyridoxal phosphate-dependent transferase [Phyllosticta citribraziliensis]|uniref:Pyridoxal phosphate-dependent transferase n=1 Tax=Phyllosticta citribraziliensis TaxID=989973 RepID=A0ABR1L3Z7_9PEZI
MPKENRKRGRRDERKKRKLDHIATEDDAHQTKRYKAQDQDDQPALPQHPVEHDQNAEFSAQPPPGEVVFYGMLDDEEQDYFKRADEMLELNQFGDPEERALFLANVYREADGKELKIANSQSCSRLMERLIQLSDATQLKNLFKKFSGHFLNLVQHRFASHCCEALFIHSAPVVTHEMINPPQDQYIDPQDVQVSMENLFLYAVNELEGNLGYLMTDRFASHTLRVLLVVLAGESLARSSHRSLLHSKKKEQVSVARAENPDENILESRAVPEAFLAALEKMINGSVAGLDTTYLRALATHPTGNPVLQLLVKLELTKFGKQRAKDQNSLLKKLLPDDLVTETNESGAFIHGMLFDTIGSRLLEVIIENAPGKLFKSMYKEFFKPRMASLARNEIAGYVETKVLERLSKEDLEEAMHSILHEVPKLVDRNRIAVIRSLIERCAARQVNTAPLAQALEKAYAGPNGFEISRLLKLGEPAASEGSKGEAQGKKGQPSADSLHGSLLAQTMLGVPGPLSGLVFDALARLGTPLALNMARSATASRALQEALTSPLATIIFRRKVIQQFYGHIGELALDPSGSHVIDAIWKGTHGLAFIRERIAEELAENEAALRESHVGRKVWRNWRMDLYKRRRSEWVNQSRDTAGNGAFLLDAVQKLLIPFIRRADDDAATKPTARGLQSHGASGPRTALVDLLPPHKLEPLLALDLSDDGVGKDGVLQLVERVLQYSVNTWDQGFLDKLYASTNAIGVASELILAVLNTNVHVYQVSPALTLVEKYVTKRLAQLIGFTSPNAGGINQPGGSASNSSSVVIARNTLYPETKDNGIGGRRFILFTSAHGHYSLEKAAQMFGFGSRAVRAVPVDAAGRMDPAALESLVVAARDAGETPFYVNATAGTTVMGSYDPFDAIADVCQKHNLWLHVDGSWGGCVIFNDALRRGRTDGIERADSVAITPHKMLGVPMTCSFLLAKDLRQFHQSMTLPAGYLFHNTPTDEIYDLADLTPQCGRRGDSLKLYLSWAFYGSAGLSSHVATAFARSEQLHALLSASRDIVLVTSPDSPPPCLQVCFYYAPAGALHADADVNSARTVAMAERLIRRGWMVDYAPGARGKFFRVVVNRETLPGTVEGLVRAVVEAGAEVVGEETA